MKITNEGVEKAIEATKPGNTVMMLQLPFGQS